MNADHEPSDAAGNSPQPQPEPGAEPAPPLAEPEPSADPQADEQEPAQPWIPLSEAMRPGLARLQALSMARSLAPFLQRYDTVSRLGTVAGLAQPDSGMRAIQQATRFLEATNPVPPIVGMAATASTIVAAQRAVAGPLSDVAAVTSGLRDATAAASALTALRAAAVPTVPAGALAFLTAQRASALWQVQGLSSAASAILAFQQASGLSSVLRSAYAGKILTQEAFRRSSFLQVAARTRPWIGAPLWDVPAALGELLRDWRWLADHQGPTQGVARDAIDAAMQARQAVLETGDVEPVIAFGRDWLGFRSMPQSRIDATVSALLEDDWLTVWPDGDPKAFRKTMRRSVNAHHEIHQPLWERQINGRVIGCLDAPSRPARRKKRGTLPDLLPGGQAVETLVLENVGGWHDMRVGRVLARLSVEERAVALHYATGDPTEITWPTAAAAAGRDAAFGIRVQRKLKRVGEQLQHRLAVAGGRHV